MKEQTKKSKNNSKKCVDTYSLKCIQQVNDIFQDETENCEYGRTLPAADSVRTLCDLINEGHALEALEALESIPEDEERTTIDNIVSILKNLDERRLHLVEIYVKAIC